MYFLRAPGDTQLDMHLIVFFFALSIPFSLRRNYYFPFCHFYFASWRRLALDVPVIPPIGLDPIFVRFFFFLIKQTWFYRAISECCALLFFTAGARGKKNHGWSLLDVLLLFLFIPQGRIFVF